MIPKLYKNILGVIVVFAFISLAVFGVLTMVQSHHHEPGCPFMTGEQSICPMGLLEHISAWRSTFTVSIPYIFLLVVNLFFVISLWQFTYPPNNLFLISRRLKRNNNSLNFLYQELFSQGILNPKAP